MASNRKSRGISMRTALLKALQKFFLLCGVVELDTIRNIGRPGYAVLKLSGRSEDAEHPTKIRVKLFRFRKRNNAGIQSCHHAVDTVLGRLKIRW